MNFETVENELLSLIEKKNNAIIAIEGKSGAGKTKIIKTVQRIYSNKITVWTSEKFISIIIEAIKSGTDPVELFETAKNDIIAIEDIDFGLTGRRIMQNIISQIFQSLVMHGKIIITGTELCQRIPDVIKNNEPDLIFLNLE